MRQRWLSSESTLTVLSKAVLIASVGLGAGLVWFGFSIVSVGSAASETKTSIESLRGKLGEYSDLMKRADGLNSGGNSNGLAIINVFQSAFESAAAERQCTLTEYTSSRSVNPYLSRYSKDSPPEGWTQAEVKAQLVGTAKSVIDTLKALESLDIPFEFQSLEFTRQDTDKSGAVKVSARVELTILIQAAEANS